MIGGVCSKCGKEGHNSRTCGKTKNPTHKKSVKKCPPGKVLNPKTNRCNKVKVPINKTPKSPKTHKKPKTPKSPKTHNTEVKPVMEKVKINTVKKNVKTKPIIKNSFVCEKCGHINLGKPKSLTPNGISWSDSASQDMINRLIKKGSSIPDMNCASGVSGQLVYDVKDKGVLLAKNFDEDVNIDGWYASEKWDGYRSVWNGQKFVSRTGKSFDVPDWFCSIMPPSIALDGELWLGRGKFEDCGLLRKKRPTKESELEKWNEEWLKNDVTFNVFDIMNLDVGFEERMKKLNLLVKDRNKCMKQLNINKTNPILAFTEQTKVNKVEALKMAKEVIKDGGEGIMLRKPGSLYEAKRSNTLYKIKEVDDMEVRIDGYKNGNGKYKDLLGSFTCSLLNKPSIKCNVSGMDDKIRNSYLKTHPIGTIITITYNGVTSSGKPRHPRYLRIRHQEGN